MPGTVVLAYSGGLDTSVAIAWIKQKYGYDVVTVTADIGGVSNLETIKRKALKVGAKKAYVIDARREFIDSYVFRALKAGAIYEGEYPLATALGRPLIAKVLVDVARKEHAIAVAHGSTGKGNDQVRFDVSVAALAPNLDIIAPAREWNMSREQTMRYAKKKRIPVPTTVSNPYSIDENPWGRSIECGVLEDPWKEPPEEIYAWTKSLQTSPAKPTYIEIEFEKGVPVALNGEVLNGHNLIQRLNKVAGNHGVGRIDHVENRLVGIKSREIYEAPAAVTLHIAHSALEALTLTRMQFRFKERVAAEYSDLIYNGLWFSHLREDLDAYIESTQRFVTGIVRVKLLKGRAVVVGRKSPYSLYQLDLATYDKDDKFNQNASVGFIQIWGLPVKIQAQAQPILIGKKQKIE